MTDNRFIYTTKKNGTLIIIDKKDNVLIRDKYCACDYLNMLNDENKQLKKEKERYKRLSEIRQQEINNRILTINEFINNCSDNKVRSVLKELFYLEVNEYDLSSENRKLLNENEQLKQQINELQFNKAKGQQEYQKRIMND